MSKTTNKFSAEVRERAVLMVHEHEGKHPSRWAAIARCTVERLMKSMELQGAVRGKNVKTTISDKADPGPQDLENRLPAMGWSTIQTGAANMCPSSTPVGWPMSALSHLSAQSGIPVAMLRNELLHRAR